MSTLRLFLLPFSLVYGAVVLVRNWFFDIGLLPVTKVAVPVISVGNISVGGTGKTPLVEYLAHLLREQGKKVAVISRGYKRTTRGYVVVSNGAQRCAEASESGDEPAQMAEKLDGVVVVVDENRVRAAQRVVRDFRVNTIILDDGFQHRYLHRHLDLVVVTAEETTSFVPLLPAGNRRETLSSLQRADAVVVSRWRRAEDLAQARKVLERWNKPVVGMSLRPTMLVHAASRRQEELGTIKGKNAVAFSGIGQPEAFEWTLESLAVNVVQHHRFLDHYRFRPRDIEEVIESYKRSRAEYILTTEKDLVRLAGNGMVSQSFFQEYPVFAVQVGAIIDEQDTVREIIQKALA